MKVALLSLVVLGSQSVILVSDRIPKLNVEALCRATTADDKAMGLALAQSFEGCMHDETEAQQKLTTIWQENPGSVRERCEGEATVAGAQSYVDLLTCLQAADIVNPPSPAVALRGASKSRNAK
jgi:hypothetical protein